MKKMMFAGLAPCRYHVRVGAVADAKRVKQDPLPPPRCGCSSAEHRRHLEALVGLIGIPDAMTTKEKKQHRPHSCFLAHTVKPTHGPCLQTAKSAKTKITFSFFSSSSPIPIPIPPTNAFEIQIPKP
jgi:hypothetical protein